MTHGQILAIVSAAWVASELAVGIVKRSGGGASSRDRGSLRILWIVITLGTFGGALLAGSLRAVARMPPPLFWIGIALIVAGVIVRATAIVTLWRFFTIDVAVTEKQELIDHGIYRFIRHPSYAGSLLSFLGLGLAFRNWIALAFMMITIAAAMAYRVHVEEAALVEHFGDRYRDYMRRTKRFVPGLM